jgi:DNA polymerase III delta prime subunit
MNTFLPKYKPYFTADFFFDLTMLRLLQDMNDVNVLFIGNPCSGKTSILSAMVREYYGLSKTDRIPENNILVINNLKEQGINFFRNEMKLFCQTHSLIQGRKKMVLIDDLDTIPIQNQQIFCNYIDKYKNHVCFIMVCTNLHNTIENLQSRLHLIRMAPPNPAHLERLATKIIENEQIHLTPDAKTAILVMCNANPRSLINILEKIFIYTRCNQEQIVDADLCKALSTSVSLQRFDDYIGHLREGRLVDAIRVLYTVYEFGYSVIDILMFFYTYVKQTDQLIEEEGYKIIKVLCKYITIFYSQSEDCIELAMFTGEVQGALLSRENTCQ